jgi:hypothetical protein
MTEVQQLVWAGLGVVAVLLLKWLFELIIARIKLGKELKEDAEEDAIARIERKIDTMDLRSRATVGALGSMNTLPELDTFSTQFRKKFKEKFLFLKENPEFEEIL